MGMGMGTSMRLVYDRMRKSLWTELFFFLFGQAEGEECDDAILAPFFASTSIWGPRELRAIAEHHHHYHYPPRSWRPNRFSGALHLDLLTRYYAVRVSG
jgi:hypothetical protein